MKDPTQIMAAYFARRTPPEAPFGWQPNSAVPAGRIVITLTLYASHTKFLPDAYPRACEMPIGIAADATIASIIAPLGMPKPLVKLVLLIVPAADHAAQRYKDSDVLAIWPPVAGG